MLRYYPRTEKDSVLREVQGGTCWARRGATPAGKREERNVTRQRNPGREFDARMASYFAELRHATMNRRGLLKVAAGAGSAAALATAIGQANAAPIQSS